MNKTKLVLLTAAALLAITSSAEAARVKRAKPSFSRPAPTQMQRAPAPVTNPVPGRPAAAQPAQKAQPAAQTTPANTQPTQANAAPANNAAPAQQPNAAQAAPAQQQGGGFVSNMMGAAVGAVAGSMIGDALGFGEEKPAEGATVNVDAQPAPADEAQPAAQPAAQPQAEPAKQ